MHISVLLMYTSSRLQLLYLEKVVLVSNSTFELPAKGRTTILRHVVD